MDSSQFDRVVRSWSDGTPRRAVLGLLAASAVGLVSEEASLAKGRKKKVTLCLSGQTLSVKKSKKGSFLNQGATLGACASSPPPPGSPPAIPPPTSPPPPPPPGPNCRDGIKNGVETAIDCGGPDCPRCANGQTCQQGRDCRSGICQGGACRICTNDSQCGNNPSVCFCALAAGHCVSNLPLSDAPFRNDCDCAAGQTCVTFAEGNRCLPPCGDSATCAGANDCISGAGNNRQCGASGRCYQSIEGGPTRCGFAARCGCASNQECETAFGPSAFCVTFSEEAGGCFCGNGITTFCARPH